MSRWIYGTQAYYHVEPVKAFVNMEETQQLGKPSLDVLIMM